MMEIICFHNPDEENGYLSNWYESKFIVDHVKFSSMEQFMMYQKAITFQDQTIAKEILQIKDSAKIKLMGRQVRNYNDHIWNGIRQIVVYEGLIAKFSQNEELKKQLKGTKTEQNLMTAFAGESQARNKYSYFASKAKKEGYVQIANIFEETANNEKEHAKMWFKLLEGGAIRSTIENLQAAAEVLKGKKVADFVKLIVTPASRKIYKQAADMGILTTLSEAGAIITHPGCGLCCGRTGGILSDGERVVATNNRNFLGRMGTSKVEIYLASPRTAASCAVAGKIVSPK